jgi:para-aminobenzoate synthetase
LSVLLVVDNGTDFLEDLVTALGRLGVVFEVHRGDTAPAGIDWTLVKAAVLTGGHLHLASEQDLGSIELDLHVLRETTLPVLGICLGGQLVAYVKGGRIEALPRPVDTMEDLEVLAADPLFEGLPPTFPVRVRHRDTIALLPEGVVNLAWSPFGRHEAVRWTDRPVYGVQFHPEASGAAGRRVLANFLGVAGVATPVAPGEVESGSAIPPGPPGP